jgi:hypothetical protein
MFKSNSTTQSHASFSHRFPEVDNVATLKAYAIEKELDDKSGI